MCWSASMRTICHCIVKARSSPLPPPQGRGAERCERENPPPGGGAGGRGVTKTGSLWALARDDRPWGGEDPPGVVYFYAPGRAGENAETFLTGFDGILQIDGYT